MNPNCLQATSLQVQYASSRDVSNDLLTSTSSLVCSSPLMVTVAECWLPLPDGSLVGFQLMALFTIDLQIQLQVSQLD